MAGVLKKSTNLTGLAVSSNARYTLNIVYNKILKMLSRMPENAPYRKYTEEIIKHRSEIINSNHDVKVIEDRIGCGQIEEVIIQAKNELHLAEQLFLAKPWESLKTPIPKDQWKWPVK